MNKVKVKVCTGCKILKKIEHFSKHAKSKDGYDWRCRKCLSDRRKTHPSYINRVPLKWRDMTDEQKEYHNIACNKWLKEHPESNRQAFKKWYSNPKNKLKHNAKRVKPLDGKLQKLLETFATEQKSSNTKYLSSTDAKKAKRIYSIVKRHMISKGYDL